MDLTKKQGYEYAIENGLIETRGEFYRLFKQIAMLKDLTGNEKIILTIILSYTEQSLEFYMSNNKLSEASGIDDSSVSRIMNSLRKKGWIEIYLKQEKGTKRILGRVAVPQKSFLKEEVRKAYDRYEYLKVK